MSKPKLVVSLAIALATLVAAGWWATKTLRLMAPAPYSTEMIAYGVGKQTADGPATVLHLGASGQALGSDQIKGPVPVSMPLLLVAKKNKGKGNVQAMLKVDASGSVAGVVEMYSKNEGMAEVMQSLTDNAHTWRFKPATERGESVPATVIVQLRF